MNTDNASKPDRAEILRAIRVIEEMIRPETENSIELLVAALEAMGSGETIRRALERLSERAPGREIGSAEELISALYDIGEGMIALKISRRLDELRGGESADAIAGLYALSELIPHDASLSFGVAVDCAQARCGEHPDPEALLKDMDFDREGFSFGSAWKFWGARSPEAIKAARAGFLAALLHAAGLGDEPEYPESIAPPRAEPDGPIPPGCPPELAEMIVQLDEAEGEEELVEALREIADAELGGVFAVVDEELWESLPEDLQEFLAEAEIGVGARLGRLIEAVLGRPGIWLSKKEALNNPEAWTFSERIEALSEALLEWAGADDDLIDVATLWGTVRLPRHDDLTYQDLLDIIEEQVFSEVDWDDHWPDQIDGKLVLGYRLGCDYRCPDFDRGYYITTVWDDDVPLFDIMSGGRRRYYVRSIPLRKRHRP